MRSRDRSKLAMALTLSCESVESRLLPPTGSDCSAQSDRSLEPAVLEHLQRCKPCLTEYREQLSLRDLLNSSDSPTQADPLFLPSVLAQIKEEPIPVRRGARTTQQWWMTAAGLLVVLTAIFLWGPDKVALDDLPPHLEVTAVSGDLWDKGQLGRADQFELGSNQYLPCDFIPSGRVALRVTNEVRF